MVGENSVETGEMEVELQEQSDETAIASCLKEDEITVTTETPTEVEPKLTDGPATETDKTDFEQGEAPTDIAEELLLDTITSVVTDDVNADTDGVPNNTIEDQDVSVPEVAGVTEEVHDIDIDSVDSFGPQPSESAATIIVEEDPDDIIVLDDEEDDEQSDVKRIKSDFEDEIMEVDELGIISGDEKAAVGRIIRKMSRRDLEDLVLAKIVEAVVAHSEVGHLRTKVVQLQFQKDKLSNKLTVMMKQMGELSSAVNTVVENHNRHPDNRTTKPPAIKFNRSVGIQTQVEPSVRSAPPKIIRVPEPSQNGVKQYGAASTGKTTVYANANNTFNPPQGQPLKRLYQQNKMPEQVKHVANNNAITITPRKTYSAASVPSRTLPIAPKGASLAPQPSPAPATGGAPDFQVGGVVDLTDDDPVPPTTNQNTLVVSPSAGTGTTTLINGVPYQLVNRVGQTPASTAGVQFVTPSAQGQGFVVSQTNIRGPNQYSKGQQVVRGVNSAISPQTVIQRPTFPRAIVSSNGGVAPRVAVTIAQGLRPAPPANNGPRKFVLPALPSTPPNRIKNDTFRSPPKPELSLTEHAEGIVLSWNLPTVPSMAEVMTYQIFACQEPQSGLVSRPSQWKKVGDVKALPLPMACTLSQFTDENRYYFIVRGVDAYNRVGPFCDPQNILLKAKRR